MIRKGDMFQFTSLLPREELKALHTSRFICLLQILEGVDVGALFLVYETKGEKAGRGMARACCENSPGHSP